LFTDDKLRQIFSLALEAGKFNNLNWTELKIADSLCYKPEKVLPPPYAYIAENKRNKSCETEMEHTDSFLIFIAINKLLF